MAIASVGDDDRQPVEPDTPAIAKTRTERKRETVERFEFDELSNVVIGCALDVHRELGPGFQERTYRQALIVGLERVGLQFSTEHRVNVTYRRVEVGPHQLDFVVSGVLILELKAVRAFTELDFAQLRSYLKAANLTSGLLLNFGTARLEIR